MHDARCAFSRQPIFPEIHRLQYDPRHGTSMQVSTRMLEARRCIDRRTSGHGVGLRCAVDGARAIR
jgi:hypothetical protein